MLDEKKFYLDLIVKEAKNKYPNAIDHRDYLSEEDVNYISNYCTVRGGVVYMNGEAVYNITYNPNSRTITTFD